jgi:hypothetical protein
MGVGCGQRATIPSDRVDDKITGQMNLLVEVPEEQMAGQLRLTRLARRRRASRKDLRLPRFHITYIDRLKKEGAPAKITDRLKEIKDSDRNAFIHPDTNVRPEEAPILFKLCS